MLSFSQLIPNHRQWAGPSKTKDPAKVLDYKPTLTQPSTVEVPRSIPDPPTIVTDLPVDPPYLAPEFGRDALGQLSQAPGEFQFAQHTRRTPTTLLPEPPSVPYIGLTQTIG